LDSIQPSVNAYVGVSIIVVHW